MKDWQRGYPLETLQALAARFQYHDGNRTLGAFSRVKENAVADWLDAGRLVDTGSTLVATRVARQRTSVKDFTGRVAAVLAPGTLVVLRAAGPAVPLAATVRKQAAGAPILWKAWSDHPEEREAARLLGLSNVGAAISASSEIRTIWVDQPARLAAALPPEENAGVLPLPELATCGAAEVRGWLPEVATLWQDHYSSYNKRRSWHAVGLRSFGGDLAFIEKPAEMSKAWKTDNAAMLEAVCDDTLLMDTLPGARRLFDALPCRFERIRLMRLTAGGELARHADITDRDAGCAPGRIARLHFPIETNDQVEFTSWSLDGQPQTASMTSGCWWYLDVRKPHRAINGGSVDRVHLVADAVVSPALRNILRSATEVTA